MKKSKLILILAAAGLLTGCDNHSDSSSSSQQQSESTSSSSESTSSSSSSSSSVDDGTVSFENLYKEIAKTQAAEISGASSTTYKEENVTSAKSDITEETYTTYADGSTTSAGTYTKAEEDKETKTDSFKRIATKITDKYEVDSGIASYDMFVEVTDFDKNIGSQDAYSDSASKKFIIASENDKGNLEDGEYILASEFGLNASVNLTSKLAYIINDLYSSSYISQTGKTGIKPSKKDNGDIEYKQEFKYSYDEDGQTIAVVINLDYVLDSTKTKLLSFDYSNSVTYTRIGDASDTYTSKYAQSGSITYGTRAESLGDNVLNPDDYFLTDVLKVGLEAKSGFNIIDYGYESGITLSKSSTEIYGYAGSKKPSKSLKTYLTPKATSNSEVVALEDGTFVIKGAGTVDLTFSYYRKRSSGDNKGVYYLTTAKYNGLTITEAKPESVIFSETSLVGDVQYGILAGTTKSFNYYVLPSAASQLATATSSDPSILETSVSKEGVVTLKGIKEGEVTVTLTSADDPNVTVTKTFYVLSADTNYETFLTSNTFYCNRRIYSYDVYLTFKTNGEGVCTIYTKDDDGNYTVKSDYDFSWELDGAEIEFTEFDASIGLSDARIVRYVEDEGKPFGLSADGAGYATLKFVVFNK